MGAEGNTPAVTCEGITKRFGSVVANDSVNLSIRYGEILALLGENGSGKTTLVNMLSGIYHPDAGQIRVDGRQVRIGSPVDAMELGIGMIHQHFKLVEVFSAMDNIVLGTREKKIPARELKEKIMEISGRFGLAVEPEKKIYQMSVSEKQTVEIMKVLYRGCRILILDEPTAVLTPQETEKLFAILRRMREQGNAVIIITHKLHEVLSISDRVAILRKGQCVSVVDTKDTDEGNLTELMVGRPVQLKIHRPEAPAGKDVLTVKGLMVIKRDGIKGLDELNFSIREGEILGVAGIAGSGQKELCESLAGLYPVESGQVMYGETLITGKTPREIAALGIRIGFVPEDRLGMGLVASMGITDNMLLKEYRKCRGAFVDRKPARNMGEALIRALDIKTPGVETPVRLLSGGNVQKVLLGREIESQPGLLITAYPVRGLDIHSSYMVYDLLNEQKKKGVSVLYVGEDLDVLLELADRILVLCHGENMGIVDARETTKEQIGLMMAGKRKEGGC